MLMVSTSVGHINDNGRSNLVILGCGSVRCPKGNLLYHTPFGMEERD